MKQAEIDLFKHADLRMWQNLYKAGDMPHVAELHSLYYTDVCGGGNHFVAELRSFCILVVYYVTCVFWWLYCTAVGNHSADQA